MDLEIVGALLEQRLALKKKRPPDRNPFTGEALTEVEIERMLSHYYPDGASGAQIDAFESTSGLTLSNDLRAWLAFSNGPSGFVGIGDGPVRLLWLLENSPHLFSDGAMPVGSDIFGNYFLMGADGFVHYTEATDLSDKYVVASTLLKYVEFALGSDIAFLKEERVKWPIERRFFVERDPAVLASGHRLAFSHGKSN